MYGFGTKSNTSQKILQAAIANGYNFLDFKDTNKSINLIPSLINNSNNKIYFCSKLVGEDSKEYHNPEKVEEIFFYFLKKSRLPYWDIYYIHTFHSYGNYNILNTYDKLLKIKKNGYIKKIGVSNITYEQLECLCSNTTQPDCIQIEIHPYLPEEKIVDFCHKKNIMIVAHSPFGSYFISEIIKEKILINLSQKYKVDIFNIILRWHQQRNIIPIPSTNNNNHLINNIKKKIYFTLTKNEIESINSLNKNKRLFIKPNHPIILKNLKGFYYKSNYIKSDNYILNKINNKGYFVFDSLDNINPICDRLNKYLDSNSSFLQKKQLYRRNYQIIYKDAVIQKELNLIANNNLLLNLAYSQINNKNIETNIYLTENFLSYNLAPQQTQNFHVDAQKKNLKVIIYLNDIEDGNFKIVSKKIEKKKFNKLKWFTEKKDMSRHFRSNIIPRLSYDELQKKQLTSLIEELNGKKYNILLFDGSFIHSGGYIKQKKRRAIYIEYSSKVLKPDYFLILAHNYLYLKLLFLTKIFSQEKKKKIY